MPNQFTGPAEYRPCLGPTCGDQFYTYLVDILPGPGGICPCRAVLLLEGVAPDYLRLFEGSRPWPIVFAGYSRGVVPDHQRLFEGSCPRPIVFAGYSREVAPGHHRLFEGSRPRPIVFAGYSRGVAPGLLSSQIMENVWSTYTIVAVSSS
ncbi:hypothetical protein RND81_10G182900 [Saponaria officinalis]|uniref:Uncharacterized protein n=1 Tax=Saponaria officinalis TaxID=3572 RepID=A0AAW1I4E0_SAPOF